MILTALGVVLIATAHLGGEGWRLARHPMPSGIALWALAHLLVTGRLAHGLVFAAVAALPGQLR